ncbi:MAG: oxidoreductase [Actinomycetota bacterium]|nr:oxidoreductase [Actinomycetota bacterium]
MSWTSRDIPDQSDRVAVITGANGGLGLEMARELARKGAHIVMAGRNQDKAQRARLDIMSEIPEASLELISLDLGSLASTEAAATTILAAHPRIDLLANNAGVMATPEGRTEDGFELQLGTNHLGHFVFTARLLPALAATPGARIVSVTSIARHTGRPIDAANPHLHGRYSPWRAYGQSKLANLHFAVELQRRLTAAGAQVLSLVAHPGLSDTDLQAASVRNTDGGASQKFFHLMAQKTGMSPAQGVQPQLRAATDPKAKGGQLYAPRFVNNGAAVRRPLLGRSVASKPAQTLWVVSERETGVCFDVAASVGTASV